MSKHIENFIHNNKDAFNDYEPSTNVWQNIQQQVTEAKLADTQKTTAKKINFYKWLAAASIALLVIVSVLFLSKNKKMVVANDVVKTQKTPILKAKKNNTDTLEKEKSILLKQDEKYIAKVAIKTSITPKKQPIKIDTIIDEMMAFKKTQEHFATLISYKEKEIKKLSDADTAVYRSFTSDMKNLNKSYLQLSKQLNNSNNKKALVNAMIYNLQIQIELLNKQLIILNSIESSQKKEKYETNI